MKPKPNSSFRKLKLLDSEIKTLEDLSYESMVSNAKNMINLIEEAEFPEWIGQRTSSKFNS